MVDASFEIPASRSSDGRVKGDMCWNPSATCSEYLRGLQLRAAVVQGCLLRYSLPRLTEQTDSYFEEITVLQGVLLCQVPTCYDRVVAQEGAPR